METGLVVLVTAGSEDEARKLAKHLLEQKLIACANLLPVNSLYMWEGEMQDDREVLMVIKTRSEVFKERLLAAIQQHHSYDVPEIIGMPVVMGSQQYLQWIADEVPADDT
jgi:periplasmic divalent cation tolerance protein